MAEGECAGHGIDVDQGGLPSFSKLQRPIDALKAVHDFSLNALKIVKFI
jgi:hypothetical protein